MIEPSDIELTGTEMRWWRRNMCEYADWRDGFCGGYRDDDELCDMCKACDNRKSGFENESVF
jgi:7-cyano-7-deazaguanine synthase in queuosine biosynthesis